MTNSADRGSRGAGHDPHDSPAGTRPGDLHAPGDDAAALDARRTGDPRYGDGTTTGGTRAGELDDPSTTAPPTGDPHPGHDGAADLAPTSSAGVPSEADITSRTRTSGTWVAVIIATLVLIVLLVFILQNLDNATIQFLGFEGTLPLGVALLFAAIAGALLVALTGAARILQLRRRVHKTLTPSR